MPRAGFTFDDSSLAGLRRLTQRGGFPSMGAAVRESVQILEILQDQAEYAGFTELLVRDTKAGKQKEVIVPSIQRIKKRT